MKRIYFLVLTLLLSSKYLKADENVTDESDKVTDALGEVVTEQTESKDVNGKDFMEPPNAVIMRLPSDSELIRSNIVDSNFDCEEHGPGYYADVDNECQIFHRCVQNQKTVFSFICPGETIFNQKLLVCTWNVSMDFHCAESEKYYEQSNQEFSGNSTAELNISDNIKNSTEITDVSKENEESLQTEFDDDDSNVKNNAMFEDIKLYEILPNHEMEVTNEEQDMIEKNSIEEKLENASVEEETEESNDYKAELIPNILNDIDASVAESSATIDSSSGQHPQKILLSVLNPIIELSDDVKTEELTEEPTTIRIIRKSSGNLRNRFLFKLDSQ